MKTCSRCGCYIPDEWNSCPACKITIEVNTTTYPRYIDRDSLLSNVYNMYIVSVKYEYFTSPVEKFFRTFEEASHYFHDIAEDSLVDEARIFHGNEWIGTYHRD